MKFSVVTLFFAAALTSVTADDDPDHDHARDHDHDGEHGQHSCACEALELGFEIDCSQGDKLLEILASLEAENCSKDCSSESCHKNFLIVQSHHDFCLHEEVPSPVEDAFHDYEGVCEECMIKRKRDPDLLDCPDAVCDDRGNEAYQVLLSSDCLTNCSASICVENYQILRSEHDNCAHDILSSSSESGIHDFEDICESSNCNSLLTDEAAIQELFCSVDMDEEESSVAAIQVSRFLVALTGIVLLACY